MRDVFDRTGVGVLPSGHARPRAAARTTGKAASEHPHSLTWSPDPVRKEQHLKQWKEGERPSSKLHHRLFDELADFPGKAEISVNRSASFSILEVDGSTEFAEPTDPGDVEVEALVTLSRRLTPMHLQ